jgi:hypothetical protein
MHSRELHFSISGHGYPSDLFSTLFVVKINTDTVVNYNTELHHAQSLCLHFLHFLPQIYITSRQCCDIEIVEELHLIVEISVYS